MTLPTAAKIAGGVTGVAGIPTSIYFAHNYATSLYEVENKVINEQVGFTVGDKTTVEGKNSWEIKVSAKASGTETSWGENGEYRWECSIIVGSNITTDIKNSLKTKFPETASGDTNRNYKEKLVKLCSQKRKESSNKKVIDSYEIPAGITDSNWETHLFGPTTPAA